MQAAQLFIRLQQWCQNRHTSLRRHTRSRSIAYKTAAQIPPNERKPAADTLTTIIVLKYTSRFAVVSEEHWTMAISA